MSLPYSEFPTGNSPILTCCQRACPAGTDVSSYIAMIAQGSFQDAIAIVREENPFPAICGRVCDHVCETYCRRAELDSPVAIRALKRFIADREAQGGGSVSKKISPWRPERVAIIGSGPAGLTAASDLVRNGFSVTVFEALPVAGGMMRVGIPDYRLPPSILENDVQHLRKLGVNIVVNSALGRDFDLASLKHQGFDAVLLATGAHGSRRLGVPGEDLAGVLPGVEFLRNVKLDNCPTLGSNVVVIGGGDVAMDAARTALRLGAKRVDLFCLESREEMPAHDWETQEALDECIQFYCGWGPAEMIGGRKVKQVRFSKCTRVFDESGKFAPQFDSDQSTTVDVDAVICAVGQYAEFGHGPSDGVDVTPNGLYRVDPETLQTTSQHVFAAGDAAYGTRTVIQAVASGHKAAASIIEYLDGKPVTGTWRPVHHKKRTERADIPMDWEERPVVSERMRPVKQRVKSFAEVNLGITQEEAIAEAERCMRCDEETKSFTYSRNVRERIYHLSRDVGRDEAECLLFAQGKLVEGRIRKHQTEKVPSFDDLVFLPANLTRLVIDPYREECRTATIIGGRTERPLMLSGPVIVGGIPLAQQSDAVREAILEGALGVDIAVRSPLGESIGGEYAHMQAVPMSGSTRKAGDAAAVEIEPSDPTSPLDPFLLAKSVEKRRAVSPGVPIGLTIAPGNVFHNVRIAVEAGVDFVTLLGVRPQRSSMGWTWPEDKAPPSIEVLAEAIESLRAINREEDIDILYFGAVKSGADVARALALGATAVLIGQAARIAVESGSPGESRSERLVRLVRAFLMEAAMLARCCGKTDVHNIEPEDLRSLTIETSISTGIPLVGSDQVFRPEVGLMG